MKRLIAFTLLLSLLLLLPACAESNEPVTDTEALKEQVYNAYIEEFFPGTYPHERPLRLAFFQYLGTDNGYHIVKFLPSSLSMSTVTEVVVAGYTFNVSSGWRLMVYKNEKLTNLKTAYFFRLVSKSAIAKAAELSEFYDKTTDFSG